jgi:hypothetical protein
MGNRSLDPLTLNTRDFWRTFATTRAIFRSQTTPRTGNTHGCPLAEKSGQTVHGVDIARSEAYGRIQGKIPSRGLSSGQHVPDRHLDKYRQELLELRDPKASILASTLSAVPAYFL